VARLFAANLKRCRNQVGLSQEEVSIRASLHRTEISQLERALRVPRLDSLVKLAASLGVEPQELLRGIQWKPSVVEYGHFRSPADKS